MESSNALKAKALALAIAIGVGSPATAVRADELQDLNSAKSRHCRKEVGEMDAEATDATGRGSIGADHAKGLPFVADDGSLDLSWHHALRHDRHWRGLSKPRHPIEQQSQGHGLEYLISKNSNRSQFSVAPNAMSSSNIGLKGTVEIIPEVSAIFNLQTSFLPTSGRLADGLGSIVQNNGVPLGSQTSNADSSRNGQAFNHGGLGRPQLTNIWGVDLRSAKRTDLGWCACL